MTAFNVGWRINRPFLWLVRFLGGLSCTLLYSLLLILGSGHRALSQSISAATITEILDSNQVYIQNHLAQVNSVAQVQQQVRTLAARAALRFDTGAIARLAHNSSLMVGQCAQLTQGTLLVNGALNGCSTSTLAGVRGTIYTLEITEAGQTIIQVFEGEVVVQRQPENSAEPSVPPPSGMAPIESMDQNTSVSPLLNPKASQASTPTEATATTVEFTPENPVTLAEGQQITVDTETNQAVIATLTPEDFINLLEGPLISGFVDLPGLGDLRPVFERLFPDIPLPYGLPSVPLPFIPRLPF